VIISQSSESFDRVAKVIKAGGTVGFRTDTFYGLGADPFNNSAVQAIRQLKGREEHKPILVLVSDRATLGRLLTNRSTLFEALSEHFWPGPLTIVGAAHADLPTDLTAGTKTLGVRLPADDNVRALVKACGGALTATSANLSGEAPAQTAKEVESYFGDRIGLIIDDGPARTDRPSTVIDATGADVQLIREGVIRWEEIQLALHRS
jgi:L-threonylcarbamoyladenylate synthase